MPSSPWMNVPKGVRRPELIWLETVEAEKDVDMATLARYLQFCYSTEDTPRPKNVNLLSLAS